MQAQSGTHIRDSVAIQIDWEPAITSRDISTAARDGVVTLTGFVHNYYEKVAAECAAKSVYGVRGVANDIEVRPGVRTDPEIASDVVHVTLDGNVEWNYQRTEVAAGAHRLGGVRDVVNKIRVTPAVSGADVKTKIEEALKRSAGLDARRISVTTYNGAVNLYGHVRSWFEREEVERAGWSAPGVTAVVDHLEVVP